MRQIMTTHLDHAPAMRTRTGNDAHHPWETAFGYTRDFLQNRFVYVVVSPRAHGLAVGVNMNPDKRCNFDCVYCEVNRDVPSRDEYLDVPVMVAELQHTMHLALEDKLRDLLHFQTLPPELLQLRHVVLSGDGEPTLCPNFCEALQAIIHLRALGEFPFFKLVLATNATGLDLPNVQLGLQSLTPKDEVWAKLDGGSTDYLEKINRPQVSMDKVTANILAVAQERPVVIQSLFPRFSGEEPPAEEIEAFIVRLRGMRTEGAQIALVQVYSAKRSTMHPDYGHLSLKSLSSIAQRVRTGTGLKVEVF